MTVERRADSPPKILIISRCAWTLFNFRLSLIKRLSAAGAHVIALGADGDGFDARLRDAGVDFRAIPVSKRGLNPAADLRLLLQLTAIVRRERPAVVHCFTIKPAIFGTLAAWLGRAPARVVTITGLGHAFTTAGALVRGVARALYKLALSRAHLVYFQNPEDHSLFVNHGLVKRSAAKLIAGSGVNTTVFAPTRLPVSEGRRPRFIMIARLLREKGVREYLAAARAVKARYPEIEFDLVGGEDQRNPSALSAEEIAALRSSTVVRWRGEVTDVRPFIADADVIVLPSYREGLPRSLLEGAAMGRPAISTTAPGCRDAVVDGLTGYLVPPQDVAALEAAMLRFVDQPDAIPSMGAAARRRVVDKFDEDLVLRETLRDYRRLLGRELSDDAQSTAS